jgi:hypothetical protein
MSVLVEVVDDFEGHVAFWPGSLGSLSAPLVEASSQPRVSQSDVWPPPVDVGHGKTCTKAKAGRVLPG